MGNVTSLSKRFKTEKDKMEFEPIERPYAMKREDGYCVITMEGTEIFVIADEHLADRIVGALNGAYHKGVTDAREVIGVAASV